MWGSVFAIHCTCCSCRHLLTSSLLSSNIPLFRQWKPCIPALFSAYYNPSLITCLLPSPATLHPSINLSHFPLQLSRHATPPARAADQVTLNICHIMSPGLLCHFSKQLGLQVDYRAAAYFFFWVVLWRGCLKEGVSCYVSLNEGAPHCVSTTFTSRPGNMSAFRIKLNCLMCHVWCMKYNIYCIGFFLLLLCLCFPCLK